jgi:hypothetical protein
VQYCLSAAFALLALAAINHSQLSDSHVDPIAGRTLEPWRRGLGFLGVSRSWPGLLLIGIGALSLLIGAFSYPQ